MQNAGVKTNITANTKLQPVAAPPPRILKPKRILQDAWVFDTFLPLFFGPWNVAKKDKSLRGAVQYTLGMRIIENKGALALVGLNDPEYINTQVLFYTASEDHDTTKIRNHRNTVLRMHFSYPSINAPFVVAMSSTALIL